MGQDFVIPRGGQEDGNVIPRNGKVAFDLPLYKLSTVAGATYQLNISYKSALLKGEYSTWNQEAPSNLIGIGWDLNIGDRITVIEKNPLKYGVYFKGVFYELEETDRYGVFIEYKTIPYSLYTVRLNTVKRNWSLFTEDGIEYIFGLDDKYNSEGGTYSQDTGTYSSASHEYTQARSLISNPNGSGTPENANRDNTLCSSVETGILGMYRWFSPTSDISKLRKLKSSWLLSHIRDPFGNIISFSYIQHISNLLGDDREKTYTVASYLYSIKVYCKDNISQKVAITYGTKDSREYSIDFIATERPNGHQQKFEKLYITKLTNYLERYEENSIPKLWVDSRVEFKTKLIKQGTVLTKRQLEEVKFLFKDSTDIQHIPSYKMEYYGSPDGVSLGINGFDDIENKYFNQKTGALYGNLKSIISSTGEKKVYKYTEHDLNGVFTSIKSQSEVGQDVEFIHTPHNYSIGITRKQGKLEFHIYIFTQNGFKREKLTETNGTDGYDAKRLIAYSENIIGIVVRENNILYTRIFTKNKTVSSGWILRITKGFDSNINYDGASVSVNYDGVVFANSNIRYVGYQPINKDNLNLETYIEQRLPSVSSNNYKIFVKAVKNKAIVAEIYSKVEEIPSAQTDVTFKTKGMEDIPYIKMSVIRKDGTVIKRKEEQGAHSQDRYLYKKIYVDYRREVYEGIFSCGGKVTEIIGIDIVGNFLVLDYKCSGRLVSYKYVDIASAAQKINDTYQMYSTEESQWSQIIKYTNDFEMFEVVNNITLENKLQTQLPSIKSVERSSVAISSSVKVSENGAIYTLYYKPKYINELEKSKTVYVNYSGDHKNSFKAQVDTTQNSIACILKNDSFAIFYSKEGESGYCKKYAYYNPITARWSIIYTGSISTQKITYNKEAEQSLNIIAGIGIALSIILLPFGLGTIAGAITTALCTALFFAGVVCESILKNSYKTSHNSDSGYFGNRFFSDGKTIWFRGEREDRLTAIGSGTEFQPSDVLTGADVDGTVMTEKQMDGYIYGYVPFFTNRNRLYYRNLKNDAIGGAKLIGGISSSYSDLYYDSKLRIIVAFKGDDAYEFANSTLTKKRPFEHSTLKWIDACVPLRVSNDDYMFYISGSLGSLVRDVNTEVYTRELKSIIPNTQFRYVDSMLEKKEGNSVEKVYIFSGNKYELVQFNSSNQTFNVIERGSLNDFIPGLEFDKIDGAFYQDGIYLLRNDKFIKFNDSKVKVGEGKIGHTFLKESIDSDFIETSFNHNVFCYNNKTTGDIQLMYNLSNSLGGMARNYPVDTVEIYSNPKSVNNPDTTIKYNYKTTRATYSQLVDSAVYSEVEIESI